MPLTWGSGHLGWSDMLKPGFGNLLRARRSPRKRAQHELHGMAQLLILSMHCKRTAMAQVARCSRDMQVSMVALQGRVLTPAQLSAGWYLLPTDAQLAKALAQQGAAWLPSVAQPALQEAGPLGESCRQQLSTHLVADAMSAYQPVQTPQLIWSEMVA